MLGLEKLPSTSGIYIFKKNKSYLYVGKSVNIKARVKSHFENAKIDIKESLIVKNSDSIDYVITDSEIKALLLEAELIQKYHPKYNVIWRDNKSYLYVKITVKEEYPKILLVRRENDGKSKYFGPFPSVRAVTLLLREIRRLIPFCGQKNISSKPCFYSKIGLCKPCPNEIKSRLCSKDVLVASNMKAEYRSNIGTIKRILSGNVDTVLRSLYKELKFFSSQHKYEEAIVLRNKILRFEKLLYRMPVHEDVENEYNQSEAALKSLLFFLKKYFPTLIELERIECYDISNLSHQNSTASMVVLQDGLIFKPGYRKFKIKNKVLRSDFSMIEEILRRRFKQSWNKPNLIVIDGGKPQVRTTLKVLSEIGETIPTVGLAKNPDRLIIGIGTTLPTVHFIRNNVGFNLLRLARDESHRFARKYHLFLRDSNFLV